MKQEEMQDNVVTVQKDDIKKGLSQLGVKPGDMIMVHSSLKSLGYIPGGAPTMIEALQETVGKEGILAMPALVACADGGSRPPFNPATSPIEPWVGIIPETFRKLPGVLRSSHPTHSVCAWGKNAADFLASSDPADVFAKDGPWGKLFNNGGKIVFIGEAIGGNTFLHACEAWILGYLDEAFAWVETPDGGKEQMFVSNYPGGCRGGWYKLGRNAPYFKRLQELGVPKAVQVGRGTITLMEAKDLFQAMQCIFKEDPFILLHKEGCGDCARIRGKIIAKQLGK
ncbi:MAG: AAC(3) family N-acetyltransferase [Victivallales bacterium]|nr:AAC(3) family N-acetyltransferase [Victivallales bacterium]